MVTKIVEAYPPHAVLLQKVGKARRQIAAFDALPQGIDANVIQVVLAIAPAADLAVFLLLGFLAKQQLLELRHQWQCAQAGFGLGGV